MPRGDRTGPAGLGPMTGRGAGLCAGYGVAGFMNPVPGRAFPGRGFPPHGGGASAGRGRGRGHRNWYWATGLTGSQRAALQTPWGYGFAPPVPYEPTVQEELNVLRDQVKLTEENLGHARERIQELEQEQGKEKE